MSSTSFPNAVRQPLRRIGTGRTKLYKAFKTTASATAAVAQEHETSIPLRLLTLRRAQMGLHFRQAALTALQISVFIGLVAAVLFMFAKASGF